MVLEIYDLSNGLLQKHCPGIFIVSRSKKKLKVEMKRNMYPALKQHF